MVENKIEELLKPVIEDMGYELWGCEYQAQGKHSLLRVFIDKSDGIGITDCERVSREVSALLDVEDPINGHYALEVSSPGIPRPLFHDWQYARYLGHAVQVKLYQPIDRKRTFQGNIVAVEEGALIMDIDQVKHRFLMSNIVKANLKGE